MLNTERSFPDCPIRDVLSRVCSKWSLLVLVTLDSAAQPLRYKALQEAIPDMSQKVLSSTLHILQADGLVEREAFAEVPPRVEYRLTPRGRSLMPHVRSLLQWATENFNDIICDRSREMM